MEAQIPDTGPEENNVSKINYIVANDARGRADHD
jgi:hypothetical protein